MAYYANAAKCFVLAKKWKEAGDPFARVEQYSGAARAYREGEHFDEMMEVLGRHI